jgi:hypothetical protein
MMSRAVIGEFYHSRSLESKHWEKQFYDSCCVIVNKSNDYKDQLIH